MASRTLTVFLVDLKGYTRRAASSSRDEITKLLRNYRKLITPVMDRYGGRIVKELGDAFLVTFESPTNAVIAGAFLQDLLRARNKASPEREQLEVRVAVHSGEVEEIGGDIFGDAVNTAYRIEAVTRIGEVYFTESVYLTMNRNEIPCRKVGERVFEGLNQPVRLYRVLQDPSDERYRQLVSGATSRRGPLSVGRRRRWLLPAALLALAALGGAVAFRFLHRPDPDVAAARALVERGRCAEAVDLLGRAFEKRPPPRPALALVEEAAGRAVDLRMAAAKDFAGARELAAKWSQRWPPLRDLPVRVALAESAHHAAAGREDEAVDVLREALRARADAWELHLALSRLYAGSGRPERYAEAVDEVVDAVARWGDGRRLPAEIREEIWRRFAAQPRALGEPTEKRARTLCGLVHRHLWPEYRRRLVAGCASDDDALRLNSFTVLGWAGATGEADLLAYHVRNLGFRWSERQIEAVAFLEARTEPDERALAIEALRAAADGLAGRRDAESREVLARVKDAVARLEGPERGEGKDARKP